MNRFIFLLVLVTGFVFAHPLSLRAQETGVAKQYSADMTVTNPSGQTLTQKIYSDGGNIRTEVPAAGSLMISILRTDRQKYYTVMTEQKMVVVTPADKKRAEVGASLPTGKSEEAGTDKVEDVSCTKYKITSDDGKVYFFWIDASTKAPVKMAAQDGSFVTEWKNVVVGPQDPSLFEPPAGFQVMDMSTVRPPEAPGDPKP